MSSITYISEAAVDMSNDQAHPDTDPVDYWFNTLSPNLAKARTITRDSDPESEDGIDLGATTCLEIDDEVVDAPRRRSSQDALAQAVALRLYPKSDSPLAALIQYEKDIVTLCALIKAQRRSFIDHATQTNSRNHWDCRILSQGPWDEQNDPLSFGGVPALPQPAEVSSKESLEPFFAHLRNAGNHEPSTAIVGASYEVGIEPYYKTAMIEFEKGVLYSDGRLDLCKMVTGPRNIGDLMAALRHNRHSKHFLLGNNIIGPTGAAEIASFINDTPNQIETWYLAGNCIDTDGFKLLVDATTKSSVITNVWLKRNRLGFAAWKDILRLVTECKQLRTLDLDQTELGDAGVFELFRGLSVCEQPVSLRHIYLNACGVGEKACKGIASWLLSANCQLQSLYVSNNPIGNDGARELAAGLLAHKSLERLFLQSAGLKDAGAIEILKSLVSLPKLQTLDIGQGYATVDLGMRFNWITEASAPALEHLIRTCRNLKYLSISYTPMSLESLQMVASAVAESESLVWYFVKPMMVGRRDAISVRNGQEYARLHKLARERLYTNVRTQYSMTYDEFEATHKRSLISPDDVRLIDSVYRNREAGLARRGLFRLNKKWDESNQAVLDRVIAGDKFKSI